MVTTFAEIPSMTDAKALRNALTLVLESAEQTGRDPKDVRIDRVRRRGRGSRRRVVLNFSVPDDSVRPPAPAHNPHAPGWVTERNRETLGLHDWYLREITYKYGALYTCNCGGWFNAAEYVKHHPSVSLDNL